MKISDFLAKHNYNLTESGSIIEIRNKFDKTAGQVAIFLIIGILLFGLGLVFILLMGFSFAGYLFMGAGIVMIIIPFYNYMVSPYRKAIINLDEKTLLFIGGLFRKGNRFYHFDEIKNIELETSVSGSGTDPFSDSNEEITYVIELNISGKLEKLFQLRDREKENLKPTEDLIRYLQDLFEVDEKVRI